jgi:hypothetical protein
MKLLRGQTANRLFASPAKMMFFRSEETVADVA